MANYVLWEEAELTHPSLSCLFSGDGECLAQDEEKTEMWQGSRPVRWPTKGWGVAVTPSLLARPFSPENPKEAE